MAITDISALVNEADFVCVFVAVVVLEIKEINALVMVAVSPGEVAYCSAGRNKKIPFWLSWFAAMAFNPAVPVFVPAVPNTPE